MQTRAFKKPHVGDSRYIATHGYAPNGHRHWRFRIQTSTGILGDVRILGEYRKARKNLLKLVRKYKFTNAYIEVLP